MKTNTRQWVTVATLAIGGTLPALSHAISPQDDQALQKQAVSDAYDRGYRAAKAEMAEAAARANDSAATAAPTTPEKASAIVKPAAPRPRPAIQDFKVIYSDAGIVEKDLGVVQKVQTEQVAASPLPQQPAAPRRVAVARSAVPVPPVRAAAPEEASVREAPSDYDTAAYDDEVAARAASRPPEPPRERLYASARMPAPVNDANPTNDYYAGQAQARYATDDAQYSYAPPPPVRRAPPPVVQPVTYADVPPRRYAEPPPPWVSQHAPPPPITRRLYWSPESGRWIDY